LELNMEILGFWHNAIILPSWEIILLDQYKELCKSGLLDATSKIHLHTVGTLDKNVIPGEIRNCSKIICTFSESLTEYEFPTLNLLKQECMNEDDGTNIWYIHIKGASYAGIPHTTCFSSFADNVWAWRKYMEYFVIENWRECVKALLENDIAGTQWISKWYWLHFSGNFWWAKAKYINGLPNIYEFYNDVGQDRHLAEFWIGLGKPKVKNFYFYSKVDENEQPFGDAYQIPDLYAERIERSDYNIFGS